MRRIKCRSWCYRDSLLVILIPQWREKSLCKEKRNSIYWFVTPVRIIIAAQWCEIRTTVFSWTPTRFPFHTGAAKKPTFGQSPRITVIGKAYWDVGHAPKDQRNKRKYMPDYAVWEI